MKKLYITLALLLSSTFCYSQEYKDGVTVVCFTASFVKEQQPKDWKNLSSADKYIINIEKHPEVMGDEKISVVPTVIIYDNGELIYRWEANILFELDVTITDIQKVIDEVIESKF